MGERVGFPSLSFGHQPLLIPDNPENYPHNPENTENLDNPENTENPDNPEITDNPDNPKFSGLSRLSAP